MYDEADEHRPGHVSVSEARQTFADLVNRVAYRKERVLVTRHGRPLAAIIPMEQVEFLERAEDAYDLQEALAALADPGNAATYSLEEVEAELDAR